MEINAQTKLCGVIGNPIAHSLSPSIHNAAFQKLGLNFVYLAFPVQDLAGAVQGLRALGNVRGASITIPHKIAVMAHLDTIDPIARHIGSVNTVVVEGQTLTGYNTDALGALRALHEAGVALTNRHVLLLGSGGAARAIAFALGDAGITRLTLLGIDDAERRGLTRDLREKTALDIRDMHLDERTLRSVIGEADVLLQCTPVGMAPHLDETCVPRNCLHPGLAVMDIVYNPIETRLIKDAKSVGCRTVRGLEMFLHQAVAQFELWTGREAPADVMRTILESRFT